jgi:predicted house-cleaning NTP pyrophosphatase (Maf/HAM1 superfamily)
VEGSTLQAIDQGQSLASRRTPESRSSLLHLLSGVTTMVGRLMVVAQQVKGKGNYMQTLDQTKVYFRQHPTRKIHLLL